MLKKFSLQVGTDIYQLTTVQKWFEQIGSQINVSRKFLLQMNLLLTESFANVVYHAHEFLPEETPIDIEINFLIDAMELRIWDFGQPFDLHAKLDEIRQQKPDFSDIDTFPTGGRGLQITMAIADQIKYERQDNRNCLIICKNMTI